jgi:hypothetical protein
MRGRLNLEKRSAYPASLSLEHFQKNCSHSNEKKRGAVFLGLGVVSVQLQGYLNLRLHRSLAQTPKILAPNGYSFSSNALNETQLLVSESSKILR